MSEIVITSIRKRFGTTPVLNDISCTIRHGEFFFLLGPSGCGKSTLLRIIAGLDQPDSGDVTLDGTSILSTPAHQRGIGMVFQQYALWPHMTVYQNIVFGLDIKALPDKEKRNRVTEALESVRLGGFDSRFPHELSGGQQQRVALARALAIQPKVILLDEPLSNLDARLRNEIRRELSELHASLGLTMVYVTHDQEDALTLASRVAVLRGGTIQQLGEASEVYREPNSRFVAEFVGDANLLKCRVDSCQGDYATVSLLADDALQSSDSALPGPVFSVRSPPKKSFTTGDIALLCIRPEAVAIAPVLADTTDSGSSPTQPNLSAGRADGEPTMLGSVTQVSFKGSHLEIDVFTSFASCVRVRCAPLRPRTIAEGDKRHDPELAAFGFAPQSKVRIGWHRDAAILVPCEDH